MGDRSCGAYLSVTAMAAALCVSCVDSPAEPSAERTTTVVLDTRALLGATQDGRSASVIARAVLRVTSTTGTDTRQASVSAADEQIVFPVTVSEGVVQFQAQVESVNETLLYAGSSTVTVDSDDFQVRIRLEALAPVLVVTPDSLRVRPAVLDAAGSAFSFRNRGAGTVQWTVEHVDPPLESCDAYSCLELAAEGGTVEQGQSVELRIGAAKTLAGVYRIQLATPQGTVHVVADADAAGVVEVVVSASGDVSGPVRGHSVALLACTEGSQTGSPGTCEPDDSIAPLAAVTDNAGVARFVGVPSGLWQVRPDPVVNPAATTVDVSAGEVHRVTFIQFIIL